MSGGPLQSVNAQCFPKVGVVDLDGVVAEAGDAGESMPSPRRSNTARRSAPKEANVGVRLALTVGEWSALGVGRHAGRGVVAPGVEGGSAVVFAWRCPAGSRGEVRTHRLGPEVFVLWIPIS